jgi:hypothetical protein
VARLGGSLVLFAAAGVFVVAGFGLCLWGVYLYLAAQVGGAGAALLTGAATLITAGILLWIGQRISR